MGKRNAKSAENNFMDSISFKQYMYKNLFCDARDCRHYNKRHCKILDPINGDVRISNDKTGRCYNYSKK